MDMIFLALPKDQLRGMADGTLGTFNSTLQYWRPIRGTTKYGGIALVDWFGLIPHNPDIFSETEIKKLAGYIEMRDGKIFHTFYDRAFFQNNDGKTYAQILQNRIQDGYDPLRDGWIIDCLGVCETGTYDYERAVGETQTMREVVLVTKVENGYARETEMFGSLAEAWALGLQNLVPEGPMVRYIHAPTAKRAVQKSADEALVTAAALPLVICACGILLFLFLSPRSGGGASEPDNIPTLEEVTAAKEQSGVFRRDVERLAAFFARFQGRYKLQNVIIQKSGAGHVLDVDLKCMEEFRWNDMEMLRRAGGQAQDPEYGATTLRVRFYSPLQEGGTGA